MLKKYFSTKSKTTQSLLAVFVILVVAGIGTYLLTGSHAASPYASSTVDNGQLGSGAVKQSCSGATDGNCVAFNSTVSTGGGGTGTGGGSGGSNMIVGISPGNPIGNLHTSSSNLVPYIRYEADSSGEASVSSFIADGFKVDPLFAEDVNDNQNTGGVSALNVTNWDNYALSWYGSNCPTTTDCPMIEVLNEPGGSWFWGNNASDQTNATAYANLLKATHTAFHDKYGSSAPLILASYDGGSAGSTGWGQEWWNASMSSYVDGVTVHPYGGAGNPASQSRLGSRSGVTAAHSQTGEPVYVTEVGWPTAVGQSSTGDSLQWPQSNSGSGTGDQCDNLYNFISWARGTGYVNAVFYFNYSDYGSNDFYGITTSGGTEKPAFNALGAAARQQANPCPNPVSY